MSDMLGKSKPWDSRAHGCCKKHGGDDPMGPKRRVEDRQWRKEAELEMEAEPDRQAGPPC